MHVFKIEKYKTESDVEIRAHHGSGKNNYTVMEKVAVYAKPNERVADWSPPVFLVKKMPEQGVVPSGTRLRHLFYAGTCKRKIVKQTSQELEQKMDGLKKTVDQIRVLKQFTSEDRVYWDAFFEKRKDGPTTQDERQEAPLDPVMLSRVKQLLWGEEGPEPYCTPDDAGVEVLEKEAAAEACAPLLAELTPRLEPAEGNEFGRKRQTQYIFAAPGQDNIAALTEERNRVRDSKNENRSKLFKNLESWRGTDDEFVESIQVCFVESSIAL